MHKQKLHALFFLVSFLKKPSQVGAMLPSTEQLAKMVISKAQLNNIKVIVELGPGTGSFTELIFKELPKNAVYIGLDLNPDFIQQLQKKYTSGYFYCDSAENILRYLSLHKIAHADCIISGLPWALIPVEKQNDIMKSVVSALGESGHFSTFTYIHSLVFFKNARHYQKRIQESFKNVEKSPIVWNNFPPAFTYWCFNPVRV